MRPVAFKCIVLVFCFFWGARVYGVPQFRQATDKKRGIYLVDGVFSGGKSLREGTSLLNIRSHYSKKIETERLVFDLGDILGRPLLSKVGYFHVVIDKRARRVVVELSDIRKFNLNQRQLTRLVKRSPVIESINYNFDKIDGAFSIEFVMKSKVAVEVFKIPSKEKASRIVLDIKVM